MKKHTTNLFFLLLSVPCASHAVLTELAKTIRPAMMRPPFVIARSLRTLSLDEHEKIGRRIAVIDQDIRQEMLGLVNKSDTSPHYLEELEEARKRLNGLRWHRSELAKLGADKIEEMGIYY